MLIVAVVAGVFHVELGVDGFLNLLPAELLRVVGYGIELGQRIRAEELDFLEVLQQQLSEAFVGMEMLHRPHAAAIGRAKVFFIEELDIAAVAVVGLERLEALGKVKRASTDVDAAVLLQ